MTTPQTILDELKQINQTFNSYLLNCQATGTRVAEDVFDTWKARKDQLISQLRGLYPDA